MRDGVDGADGLAEPRDAALSPDGAHLYVAAHDDDAIGIFARDAGTGLLAFAGLVRDGEGGVADLSDPQLLAVAPDGAHLYAVSDDALVTFTRDGATGALAFAGSDPSFAGATALLASRDGRRVYTGSGPIASARLDVFERDPISGALSFLEARLNGVADATVHSIGDLAESADGRHLYASSYSGDAVQLFSTRLLDFREVQRNGISGVGGMSLPVGVAWSPDGRHAYVAGSGSDAIATFAFDAASETLGFVQALVDGAGGGPALASPRDVVVSPDGRHVYVVAFGDDAVTTFARDAASGALTYVAARRDGFFGVEYMDGPLGVTTSPDGARVLVASQEGIAIFTRSAATGTLTYFSNAVADSFPNAVAASADGRHVYLNTPGAITILAYDAETGLHDYVASVIDGVDGVEGLAGAADLAVSPDGAHVYVSVATGVLSFERDPATGRLALLERLRHGVDGVRGLDGPRGIAIRPDGHLVLVASFGSNGLAAFARDASSGRLAFAQLELDGANGVDGLDDAAGVAVAPSGRHALATGSGSDHALVLFVPEPGARTGAAFALAALLGQFFWLTWVRKVRISSAFSRGLRE